jgi:hypothetical protein
MSDFKFEFPKQLPQDQLKAIETTSIYWIKTFNIKNDFSKEERRANYREIVKRDIKAKLGESPEITEALDNALDFYEKMITQ